MAIRHFLLIIIHGSRVKTVDSVISDYIAQCAFGPMSNSAHQLTVRLHQITHHFEIGSVSQSNLCSKVDCESTGLNRLAFRAWLDDPGTRDQLTYGATFISYKSFD